MAIRQVPGQEGNPEEHEYIDPYLEQLHQGQFPKSKVGDFSDVKVVSPYGEIAWTELSRISNKEMRQLMLDIEKRIQAAIVHLENMEIEAGSPKLLHIALIAALEDSSFVSWDKPKHLRHDFDQDEE